MASSERDRAVAFLRATDCAVAEDVTAATITDAAGEPCGARAWVLSDRRRARLWDANYLYVERAGRADAPALARTAEHALGSRGVPIGGVVIELEAEGERLERPFAELGWRAGPLLLMVHRDPSRLTLGTAARRLRDDEATDARRAVILAESWGSDAVADQILDRAALIARADVGVSYGADHRGAVASTCVVLRRDDVAQLDDVGTVPRARGRGLARAVVSFATEQARRDAAMVFLCADALDWPHRLYARLGYEPVGVLHRFFPVLPRPVG